AYSSAAIVIGRENGDLFRLDPQKLSAVSRLRPPEIPARGPVEYLTFSPDGTKLAVSIVSQKPPVRADAKTISCDIELLEMPAAKLVKSWSVSGLVRALAFSPKGDRLAYSGGPAQTVFVQDLDPSKLNNRPLQLEGQGSTPLDLGFSENSQVIGFDRGRIDPANPPATSESFDLSQRRFSIISRNQLR